MIPPLKGVQGDVPLAAAAVLKQNETHASLRPETETTFAGLRKNSILAEVLLWKQLEGSRMRGYSFLRQRPIYKYIVDFYSPKLRVVIEIDGESHRDKFARDHIRQKDWKVSA